MSKAVIGYTGFVGSNLDHQIDFTHRYNSQNIPEIDGSNFDLLICAGVRAEKWLANKEPENDGKHIDGLVRHLETITAKKFVLISTVDVYPEPVDVDETTAINISACHPYGKHRLELEEFVSQKFDSHIIRLPGLFGTGLKKNIIYDFLNDHNTNQINPNGVFQFYCLDHLARDINSALEQNIRLLNVSTEPISVGEASEICTGQAFENSAIDSPGNRYDFRSIHAEKFGGSNGYLYSKQQVLHDLKGYVRKRQDK